jgi:hypothetical protein
VQRLEKERLQFRPVGTQVATYTRPAPAAAGTQAPATAVPGTTTYEVYRVRALVLRAGGRR